MKTRAFALILCICMLACLSGCGKPDIVGDNLVMQAREDFEKLDSAQIVMTNTDTDKVEQTFTFKYEDGVLVYKDWKLVDGKENIEYNNGEVNVYYQNEKYYQYTKGDDKFLKFTRTNTHKKTQDTMLTYIPSAITDAKMEKVDDKEEITHVYDVSKVNPTVPKDTEATGFAVRFVFDEDDKLEYFTETTLYKTKDGTEHRLAYKTEIKDKNSVGEIENIIKK
ncbi:MAG: hypothetical protein II722_08500 [Ruminococcus sp.]|nr:hypothetical protein [Ruminococcus sp.]